MGCCQSSYTTVSKGERYVLRDREGNVTTIDGPARVKLEKECRLTQLNRIHAHAQQFLVVTKLDGSKSHIPGPTSRFLDVGVDESIVAREAVVLDANESLVVYRRCSPGDGKAKAKKSAAGKSKKSKSSPAAEDIDDDAENDSHNVERDVIRGPCIHVPEVDEWTHSFSWHGTDKNNKTRKVPNALKFTKLRVIPDQMYYNVVDVRTKDDAVVTVKLMLFFELRDIERMLDRTHDPVADLCNAVTADVVAFSSQLTSEELLAKTDLLNELETYSQLMTRSKSIGYSVSKVVYRGYHASDALQQMHDDAIQARTQLRLESETEAAAQELADLQLKREFERSKKKQEMQTQETEHRNALSRAAHEEKMHQLEKDNKTRLAYLNSLKELGVDVTSVLVSQEVSVAAVSKHN